jgi:hypothetical protein
MHRIVYLLLLFSMVSAYSQECKTYALHYDNVEEMEYFCSIDPQTGEVVKLNFIPDVQSIQHGFSGISSIHGLYYFYGLNADNNGVFYSMDLNDGEIANALDFPTSPINGNIIEMHYHPFRNLIYALHWDQNEEMEYFISFSPISGEIVKIDSLPEVHLIQSDFSAINYLTDEFYFMGIDYDNQSRLYTIDISTGEIKHSPITPSANINGGLNELEVDVYRGNLHSLHYDQSENIEYFTRINKQNGEVTKIAPIAGVQYIQAGFSAINSNDGLYYFHGITANNESFLYTIDIFSGQVMNQVEMYGENLNGGLNELQFPDFEPIAPGMSQTSICHNDSAMLWAPEGFASYLWSNGSTSEHIFASDSSQYSLILTRDYGCTDTILPLPLQVFNCDNYSDSIVQIHDTCFFDPQELAMNYLSDIDASDYQISLTWNFVSINSDTLHLTAEYEISENGLYELIMGFDCGDKSETIWYSNMIEIDHLGPLQTNIKTITEIETYPNPFKDVFYIKTKNNSPLKIKMLDGSNRLVFEHSVSAQENSFNLGHLPAGIYILILESIEGVKTQKVIKTQ